MTPSPSSLHKRSRAVAVARIPPMRRLGLCGLFAAGSVLAAAALSGQTAQAADMSSAAASALKVLALPLPDSPHPNSSSGTPGAPGVANAAYDSAPALPNSITVARGESIDAVIRRGLPGLPLRDEFMRKALAKANPRIFPKGTTYPVRPGTVLQLPSHEDLRQLMLAQYPHAAALFKATPATPSESAPGQDKRHWVRFP